MLPSSFQDGLLKTLQGLEGVMHGTGVLRSERPAFITLPRIVTPRSSHFNCSGVCVCGGVLHLNVMQQEGWQAWHAAHV